MRQDRGFFALMGIFLAVALFAGYVAADAVAADVTVAFKNEQGCKSTITKGDISWTLSKKHPAGQFADGSWWVCPRADDPNSPIITAITPEQIYTGGDPNTLRNGSIVNPPAGNVQWTDGRGAFRDPNYNKTLPFALDPNSTLMSSKSLVAAALDPNGKYVDVTGYYLDASSCFVEETQLLTCLPSRPTALYFRPPYIAGASKALVHLASACDWNALPNLVAEPNQPAVATVAAWFANPWIDNITDGSQARAHHPADSMPNYGREIAWNVGDAMLMLCCNHTAAEKQSIGVGMVQAGIDIYANVLAQPEQYAPNAGLAIGRGPMVVFAGYMLNDSAMMAACSVATFHENTAYFGPLNDPNYNDFPLEGSLWTGWGSGDPNLGDPNYQADVKWVYQPNRVWEGYPLSQWMETPPAFNTPGPSSQYPPEKFETYRRLCAKALPGQALAMLILNLEGHFRPPYFWYVARTLYENDSLARNAMAAQAIADDWNSLRVTAIDLENEASYAPELGPGEVLYSPFTTNMAEEYWGANWPY